MRKILILLALAGLNLTGMAGFYVLVPSYQLIFYPSNLLGLVIAVSGFTIMGKTRDLLRRYQNPQTLEMSGLLITEGVFSKTRNPMYLGMFLLLFGIGIILGNALSILASFAFLGVVAVVFVPREEQLLHDTFGKRYTDYKTKVRRWV